MLPVQVMGEHVLVPVPKPEWDVVVRKEQPPRMISQWAPCYEMAMTRPGEWLVVWEQEGPGAQKRANNLRAWFNGNVFCRKNKWCQKWEARTKTWDRGWHCQVHICYQGEMTEKEARYWHWSRTAAGRKAIAAGKKTREKGLARVRRAKRAQEQMHKLEADAMRGKSRLSRRDIEYLEGEIRIWKKWEEKQTRLDEEAAKDLESRRNASPTRKR